jgi:DNA-binding PadR family transcriptional regulator
VRVDDLRGRLDGMVLAVLERHPMHGYAVIEALSERSGGRLSVPTGTVYPALRRLERAGLLHGEWGEVDGRRRRTYRLTEAGLRSLAEERDHWSAFANLISQVMRA